MKKIMKTVQSSYLHLSNILSSRVKFSSQVIESSYRVKLLNLIQVLEFNFSTQLDTFSKKFQLDVIILIKDNQEFVS